MQKFDYMAGQYTFMCVPGISRLEWHPFSLSTHPDNKEVVMLHVRVLGNWTRELYKLAAQASLEGGLGSRTRTHAPTPRVLWLGNPENPALKPLLPTSVPIHYFPLSAY